jgi:hypothetical protein
MAQSGYTPLSLYYSATASTAPLAANLVAGELALNTNDGKLYYKDSSGVVQVLATKAGSSGSFGALTATSITDSGLTAGRVVYAGTGGLLSDSANHFWDNTNSRLGIGTTTPTQKLQVNGAGRFYTGAVSTVGAVASSALLIDGAGSNGNISQIGFGYDATATYMPAAIYGLVTTQSGNTAQDIAFATRSVTTDTAPTERMRIDSAGNVGIAVTPSAWSTGYKSLQINTTSAITASTNTLRITNNEYVNTSGVDTYLTTNFATAYLQDSAGKHAWYNAPSGTAGTAVSFTQAMVLDNSGNLGIGITSPTITLDVFGSGMRVKDATRTVILTQNYSGGVGALGSETNNSFMFITNNTERMRIDSSGNVGIGVTPSAWTTSNSVKALQIGNTSALWSFSSTNAYLSNNSYYNGSNRIYSTTNTAAELVLSGNVIELYGAPSGTAGTAVTFTKLLGTEYNKSVSLQGATSQSGTGITFPATQSASSDANTLDDYEEGTWTPALSFGGSGTGITYAARNGRYTKIGRMVTVGCYINLSSKGSATGNVQISGLPFPAYTGGGTPTYMGPLAGESGLLVMPTGTYVLAWSDSTLYLRYNGTTSFTNLSDANFTNSGTVYATVTYEAT